MKRTKVDTFREITNITVRKNGHLKYICGFLFIIYEGVILATSAGPSLKQCSAVACNGVWIEVSGKLSGILVVLQPSKWVLADGFTWFNIAWVALVV